MLTKYTRVAAVAALLAPAVARADAAPASQSFVIRGCADDALVGYAATPTGARPVFGRLACFFGTGVLTRDTSGPAYPDLYYYAFTGGLTTTLATPHTRVLYNDDAPWLTLTVPGQLPALANVHSPASVFSYADGYTTPLRAVLMVGAPFAAADFTGGTLHLFLAYTLDDDPGQRYGGAGQGSKGVVLSVTATPEPAPLALTAAALAGAGLLAWRRRRTA